MNNLRNTKQKNKIIKYLEQNSNRHLTIQEIKSSLDQDIGLTTIYRMINTLIETGNISKISLDNKQGFCYQYNKKNESCNNHYHLICEKCGKLFHFESKLVNDVCIQVVKDESFEINKDKVAFYGICLECKKISYEK